MDDIPTRSASSWELRTHVLPSDRSNNRRTNSLTSRQVMHECATKGFAREGEEFEDIIYLGNDDDQRCARALAKLTITEKRHKHGEKTSESRTLGDGVLPRYTRSDSTRKGSGFLPPRNLQTRQRKTKEPRSKLGGPDARSSSSRVTGSEGGQPPGVDRTNASLPTLTQISEVLCRGTRYGYADIHAKRRARTTQIEEYLRSIEKQYNIFEDKAKLVTDWLQSLED